LLLAASLAIFHLGNAAMLPLYGMAVVTLRQADPGAFTAQTLLIAQAVMLVAAWLAPGLIRRYDYWRVMLVTYLALPARGLIAALWLDAWGVWPVQVLDGISAGLQGVVVPALVVRLLQGSGRVNAGQRSVMTIQGIGAASSPALGGMLAQRFGYPAAFLALGAVAAGALVLWLVFGRMMRRACRTD
jgi:hypothetical protein